MGDFGGPITAKEIRGWGVKPRVRQHPATQGSPSFRARFTFEGTYNLRGHPAFVKLARLRFGFPARD